MYLPSQIEPSRGSDRNRAITSRIKPVLLLLLFTILRQMTYSQATSYASEYGTIEVPVPYFNVFSYTYDSLSADGNTGIAQFSTESNGTHVAIWSYSEKDVVEPLYAPDGYRSIRPRDISADGSHIIGSATPNDSQSDSFLWTKDNDFQILSPPYDSSHSARSISADGQTVVGVSGNATVWKWTEADGFQELPVNYDETGSLRGITPDASTWVFQNAIYHADGRLEFLPENERNYRTRLFEISDDGRYAMGRLWWDGPENEELSYQAIRWEVGTDEIQRLGTPAFYPAHDRSMSLAVSADGQVILGVSGQASLSCGSSVHYDAFVWDELHGMRALPNVLNEEYGLTVGSPSHLGPRLGVATGISDDKRTIFGHTRELGCGEAELWYARLDWPLGTIRGDLEWDGDLDVADLDKLLGFIREGEFDSQSDFNFDQIVDQVDLAFWVHDLKQTYFGDANLDGEFNSSDLVTVFEAGHYEDNIPLNSTWATGDWNGDGDFTTRDLVSAFEDGGYEQGPRAAIQSVPEPSATTLLLAALVGAAIFIRQRKVMR